MRSCGLERREMRRWWMVDGPPSLSIAWPSGTRVKRASRETTLEGEIVSQPRRPLAPPHLHADGSQTPRGGGPLAERVPRVTPGKADRQSRDFLSQVTMERERDQVERAMCESRDSGPVLLWQDDDLERPDCSSSHTAPAQSTNREIARDGGREPWSDSESDDDP